MRSKISFFNKGLFFSNLKRFSWAAILETIVMFLSLPLPLMMHPTTNILTSDILTVGYTGFVTFTLCVYPVVLAVLLFSYLHKVKMTTALHGLPLSRAVLFGSTVLSGIVLVLIPIVFNTLMIVLINCTMYIGTYIYMVSILRWATYAFLLSLVLFSLTTFVGMFVGNAAAQLVFTYILHFLPLALFAIFTALCQIFLYGYDSSVDIPRWILELPMMTILHDFREPCGYYLLLFAILSVVLLALAMYTYKRRALEYAGDIVVFGWLKPVFKYGTSICLAALGYLFIAGIAELDAETPYIVNIFVGVAWAFLGYCIAQMLLLKTWRIFRARIEMFAVCLAAALLFAVLQSDAFGFESRIPVSEDVQSIELSGFYEGFPEHTITVTEPGNIARVLKLHQMKVEELKSGKYAGEADYITIAYHLSDGKTMRRAYHLPGSQTLLDLYNATEVKRAGYPMLYAPERIKRIDFEAGGVWIQDREDLIEAMRKDVDNRVIQPAWVNSTMQLPDSEVVATQSEASYYLEFEMYLTEQERWEKRRDDVKYYYVRIRANDFPETYAILSAIAANDVKK